MSCGLVFFSSLCSGISLSQALRPSVGRSRNTDWVIRSRNTAINFRQCFAYFHPPTIRWHAYKTLIFYFFFFIFSAVGNSLFPIALALFQPASLVISDRPSPCTHTQTLASSHWATEFAQSGFPNFYHASRKRCRWTRCLCAPMRSVVCFGSLLRFSRTIWYTLISYPSIPPTL